MQLEELGVHAGFVVVALEVCFGDEFHEVFVPCIVFGQKRQVVSFGVDTWFFVKTAALGDVCFNANDRFNAGFVAFVIKLDRAVHCAMVSECKSWHTKLFGAGDELGDLGEAVKERVVRMGMEVDV